MVIFGGGVEGRGSNVVHLAGRPSIKRGRAVAPSGILCQVDRRRSTSSEAAQRRDEPWAAGRADSSSIQEGKHTCPSVRPVTSPHRPL